VNQLQLGLTSLDFGSVEECVDALDSNKLACFELYVGNDFEEDALSFLKQITQDRGIKISCVSTLAKLAQAESDIDAHLNLIDLSFKVAKSLGVNKIGFMYGGSARLNRFESRKRFISRITPFLQKAESSGITILIENVFSRSPSGDLDSVEVVAELFDSLDSEAIKLNFDVGNFAIAGVEAYPYAFESLKNIIGGIHLKDVSHYRAARHGDIPISEVLLDYKRGLFIPEALGEGILNSAGLIESLLTWEDCPPVILEFHCNGESRSNLLSSNLNYIYRSVEDFHGY
jgi:sugar phosphate isomerase/epimerase